MLSKCIIYGYRICISNCISLSGKVVTGHGAESVVSLLLRKMRPSLCNIEHTDINPDRGGSLAG
jgi:hypothetical protein